MMRNVLLSITAALALAAVVAISADASVSGLKSSCPGKGSLCQPVPVFAASYTGPGDVQAYTMFWGLRAVNAAKATAAVAALDIRRADGQSCTVHVMASGDLDVSTGTPCTGTGPTGTTGASTVTGFLTSTTAGVSKFYDQMAGNACTSASCDLIQATTANQPEFLLSGCPGTGVCLRTTTNGQAIVGAHAYSLSNNIVTISAVAQRSAATIEVDFVSADNSNHINAIISSPSTLNLWRLWANASALDFTSSDAALHAANGVINGASSSINIDGTRTTGSLSGGNDNVAPSVMRTYGTIVAYFKEGGIVDAVAASAGTQTSLCHNQFTYWGTATSC